MNLIEKTDLEGIIKDTDFERLLNEKSISISEDDLNHPEYGNELKSFYVIVFNFDKFLAKHSIEEIFYSKYYYFIKFVETCKRIHGSDAGLDQQVFMLLEEGGTLGGIDWNIVEAMNKRVVDELL